MATIKGIVAGISVDGTNLISPEFDSIFYNFIFNISGHSLSFTKSGTALTVNGFAIADGVRGFFDNETITVAANGYLYVKFTTYHDETVADTVELEWSTTALTETHDNIGSVAGIYRMKVLTIVNGDDTKNNFISTIKNTQEADIVTNTIAENATGTTQPTTDSSKKVATTEFVNNAVTEKYNQFMNEYVTGTATVVANMTVSSNSLTKQARTAIIDFSGAILTYGGIQAGTTLITLPEGFKPAQQFSYSNAVFNTDGTVVTTVSMERGDSFAIGRFPYTTA